MLPPPRPPMECIDRAIRVPWLNLIFFPLPASQLNICIVDEPGGKWGAALGRAVMDPPPFSSASGAFPSSPVPASEPLPPRLQFSASIPLQHPSPFVPLSPSTHCLCSLSLSLSPCLSRKDPSGHRPHCLYLNPFPALPPLPFLLLHHSFGVERDTPLPLGVASQSLHCPKFFQSREIISLDSTSLLPLPDYLCCYQVGLLERLPFSSVVFVGFLKNLLFSLRCGNL